jgi:uncharacterized protein (DUF1800 family)
MERSANNAQFGDALAPFEAGERSPWNRRRAGHLLRRAGFGGSIDEIDALVELGPAAAARSLVFAPADPALAELDALIEAVLDNENPEQLRAWWLRRMTDTKAPFREKLALFLHGHFATAFRKVRSVRAMHEQARVFLRDGAGPFAITTKNVIEGAAMLIYLDGAKSERARPNENLARELMELFTLGRGNYSERDIKEAARALTGWRVAAAGGYFHRASHDAGSKSIFGSSGNFGSAELAELCVSREACAAFLARKLLVFFAEPEPPAEVAAAFAALLREKEMRLGDALAVLFTSQYFHSDRCYRALVKSPVEFAVGALRALGGRAAGAPLATAIAEMGQRLFDPPSVKGWDGGMAWIHSATWLARTRFAHDASSENGALSREFEPRNIPGSRRFADFHGFAFELLLQGDAPARVRERIAAGSGAGESEAQRAAIQAILLLPEYHCS